MRRYNLKEKFSVMSLPVNSSNRGTEEYVRMVSSISDPNGTNRSKRKSRRFCFKVINVFGENWLNGVIEEDKAKKRTQRNCKPRSIVRKVSVGEIETKMRSATNI